MCTYIGGQNYRAKKIYMYGSSRIQTHGPSVEEVEHSTGFKRSLLCDTAMSQPKHLINEGKATNLWI
jgi:hypothetical protein